MIYETVIGLEVHVELATQTKIFCGCENKFGSAPNACCPVCIGMPGCFLYSMKKAVEYAVRAGLATSCTLRIFPRWTAKGITGPAQGIPDIAVRPADLQRRLGGYPSRRCAKNVSV